MHYSVLLFFLLSACTEPIITDNLRQEMLARSKKKHEADAAELSALKVLLAPSPRLTLTSRFRCRPRSLFVLLSDTHSLRSGRNGSVASDGEHTCSAHGCQAPAMVIVVAAVRIDMHLDIIMYVNGCVCDILYVRRHRYAN